MQKSFSYKGRQYKSTVSVTNFNSKSYYDVFLIDKSLQNKFRPHLTIWKKTDKSWGFSQIEGVNEADLKELVECIKDSMVIH